MKIFYHENLEPYGSWECDEYRVSPRILLIVGKIIKLGIPFGKNLVDKFNLP